MKENHKEFFMNIFSNFMYNQSFAVKGKVNIKRLIVSLIITIAIEFVAFYVMIPAFNIHSMEFWEFQSNSGLISVVGKATKITKHISFAICSPKSTS